MKNKQISLDIDPTVKPIAQPNRRIPFNLRGKIRDKTTELLHLGIIEPVEGPGARFSKVPIINGPGKLSRFPLKIEVSIVLHLT